MINKKRAWEQLRSRYWIVFMVILVASLISGAMAGIPIIGWIAAIILIGPIMTFMSHYLLKIAEEDVPADSYEDSIKFTQTNFKKLIAPYLLMGLYQFLWAFVPIVGIVKMYSYSQTLYLLARNPELTANEAITQSRELMNGHKLDLFVLQLSFIGWYLLGIITFGLGVIFLMPYYNLTMAHFHKELIDNNKPKVVVDKDDFFEQLD